MSPLTDRTDHARRTLPIASGTVVRAHVRVLLREHRRALGWVLLWHLVAAVVGLAGPWVVGQLVGTVTTGRAAITDIDVLVGLLAVALVAETAATWVARRGSFVLAEQVFARLREDFVASAVRLPLNSMSRRPPTV